jgi:hypothetical protein
VPVALSRSPIHKGGNGLRIVAPLAVLGLVGVVTGCGSGPAELGTPGIARSIAQSILVQRHLYAQVRCPQHVRHQRGRTFTCAARLDVGVYPIRVSVVDDKGDVRWASTAPLVALKVGAVESAIERSVRRQRGLRATVTCPKEVLQKAGVNFSCTAKVNGRASKFDVTQTDDKGHVRFVGR